MESRERILAALSGEDSDRVPLVEIGIWPETLQRWRGEGLPGGLSPHDFFGLDKIEFFSYDASLGFPERTISENGEFRVYIDGDGCTYRMFLDRPGAPQLLASSVTREADWDTLKGRLRPDMSRFHSLRKDIVFGQPLPDTQQSRYDRCRKDGAFTVLVPVEPCWYFLRLLGEEGALMTIAENPDFVAVSPYAPRFPFETWVLPKQHGALYEDASRQQYANLAGMLKDTLQRMNRALLSPSYNLIVHSSPFSENTGEYYHWHVEIMPRLTRVAGFEWGTGFYINPTGPEEAAQVLREVPS